MLFAPNTMLRASALSAAVSLNGRPARDAGIVPHPTQDQTAGINALVQATKAAGGGKVTFEPGTYCGNVEIDTGVVLEATPGTTVIRAPGGSNKPPLASAGFVGWLGTNDFAGNSPHAFGLRGLVLDGNAAQQTATGAARDVACGLQLYGFGYAIDDVEVRNALGHGARGDWGLYGEFHMQALVRNLRIDGANRHGVRWNGPHDSLVDGVFVIDASQEADAAFDGIWTGSEGPGIWSRVHPWHRSAATKRMRAAFSSGGLNTITASALEGGRILYEARENGQDLFTATRFFACYGAADGAMCDIRASSVTFGAGCAFQNTTGADVFALRLGRSGAGVAAVSSARENYFLGFATRGPWDLPGDGGLNRLGGIGYGCAAPQACHAASRLDWISGGPDVATLWEGYRPGPYASEAAAKTAGVRYGEPFLASGGGVSWNRT